MLTLVALLIALEKEVASSSRSYVLGNSKASRKR
jgi:hypothetical protein